MSDHIYIGKIVAAHGLNGELVLKHVLGKKTDFIHAEAIFIEESKNICIPFFHQKSIVKNSTETIFKLESIDTKETATKLLRKNVWLTKNDFEKLVSKKAIVNIIGFAVIDNNDQLGKIEAVIEQRHQILIQISINKKEVLIPLHAETLKKIDRKKKEVHVALPEGLLDIYLGD